MLQSDHQLRWVLPALALVALSACDKESPKGFRSVDISVATQPSYQTSAARASAFVITGLRLVVGQAALGSGDQFGCVDCQNSGPQPAAGPAPALITVPLDGSPVSVRTEQVAPGVYSMVEVELTAPDAATLAVAPGWPAGATLEVTGSYNGTAFTLPVAIQGSFRESLTPPVSVPAGGSPRSVSVTITLPVATWLTSNGASLDPSNATDRARIEANARASFAAPETEPSTPESEG